MSLRALLRRNLQVRMARDPDVDSPARLARRCRWPRGRKKGQPIAPRTIGYIFEESEDSPSPSLDVVEAIATALGIKPWELIMDLQAEREEMIGKMFAEERRPHAATPPDVHVEDRRVKTQDLSRFVKRRRSE